VARAKDRNVRGRQVARIAAACPYQRLPLGGAAASPAAMCPSGRRDFV